MNRILSCLAVSSLAALLAACGGGDTDEPGAAEPSAVAQDGSGESAGGVAAGPDGPAPAEDAATAAPADEPAAADAAAAKPAAAVAAAVERPANFALCGACHKVEPGQHGIGPSLAGVFGRKAGQAAGFEYSLAMKNSGLTWNEATLNRYLENPRGVVPDTTMVFVGEKNAEKRQALIAYLKSL